eukprot:TRINITY_DN22766_c0_g1_i2.p1 TRINITY_DN22766_c0_g1~~TRINITY_DN22766_c0_g1_i2.p1  ORF type:complete len:218 (+),score=36.58 TRINITY_DN22766_c0_g1_i2:35-655(+)
MDGENAIVEFDSSKGDGENTHPAPSRTASDCPSSESERSSHTISTSKLKIGFTHSPNSLELAQKLALLDRHIEHQLVSYYEKHSKLLDLLNTKYPDPKATGITLSLSLLVEAQTSQAQIEENPLTSSSSHVISSYCCFCSLSGFKIKLTVTGKGDKQAVFCRKCSLEDPPIGSKICTNPTCRLLHPPDSEMKRCKTCNGRLWIKKR